MNHHFDTHFKTDVVTIHPGEFYSTGDDILIVTVLGSCISIVLYDTQLKLGGMNHFMLSESKKVISEEDKGRFGNYAIELLLNDLYAKGAQKKDLKAKVFGGSNVFDSGGGTANMIGLSNIDFALRFLETERIPVLANDTGGIFPRKIYFHPATAKVYLKRIKQQNMDLKQIKIREKAYQESLQQFQQTAGDITWF